MTVEAVTINELFYKFGIPRYMKAILKVLIVMLQRNLANLKKPKFVSFETNKKEFAQIYSYLYVAGYTDFQLRNQRNNPHTEVPLNSKEGNKINYKFSKYSSGLFGDDLPSNKWLNINESISNYVYYKKLVKK